MGLSGEPRVLARPAGTSSVDSCPRGQQGPHWRVTSCTWAPRGPGSSQLGATGVPLSSCCSVVGSVPRPDIQPRTEGRSYKKKMNFLQEPRLPGIPGQGMRDPCRGGPIAHRTPGCSPWKRGAGKDPLSPSVSFKNVPWCVIWQFQHFELNYGN